MSFLSVIVRGFCLDHRVPLIICLWPRECDGWGEVQAVCGPLSAFFLESFGFRLQDNGRELRSVRVVREVCEVHDAGR